MAQAPTLRLSPDAKRKLSRMSRLETALICRGCGGTLWAYRVTYSTEIDTMEVADNPSQRKQVLEEFRCAKCDLKANLENNAALRKLPIFRAVRRVEDNNQ